ncbi:Pre-mRNA-processing factor 39 [Hordeum vulgare]|nr:Pre-mRNA-processing factor 39 [Hordeum vulgare]
MRAHAKEVRHRRQQLTPEQRPVLHASKEEARLKEEEEEAAAYQAQMAEAMALSNAGAAVVPPLAPPSSVKAELGPLVLRPDQYAWDGVVSDWVSTPPVCLGATP